MNFEQYPFEKLNELLKGVKANDNFEPSVLTIGEPQFETPKFIQNALSKATSLLKKYPASAGLPELKEAMINFVKKEI